MTKTDDFLNWVDACTKDWLEKNNSLDTKFPAKIHDEGYWQVAYCLKDAPSLDSLNILKSRIEEAEQRYTGWPVWWVPTREDISSIPDKGIVVWLGKDSLLDDSAHVDYWRIDLDGKAFLIRGYQEDVPDYQEQRDRCFPHLSTSEKHLEISIPVWRMGECLMHASKMAELFQCPNTTVEFKFSWGGLCNRILSSSRDPLFGQYRCNVSEFSKNFNVIASDIPDLLPEIVHENLRPLYERFDFFSLPKTLVIDELERMRRMSF